MNCLLTVRTDGKSHFLLSCLIEVKTFLGNTVPTFMSDIRPIRGFGLGVLKGRKNKIFNITSSVY